MAKVDVVQIYLENKQEIDEGASSDDQNFFWACCCRVFRRAAHRKLKELMDQ